MSYEPLHHKYRPQTFANLVGQEAIATTLSEAIKQRKIAPAYLFTGPRGTGKTSSARILAKSLNCLSSDRPTPTPCGKCEVCQAIASGSALDVMEIDAASNTGVDNIREIIERCQFAPVQSRYKVYAIDECLTGDSQIRTNKGLIRIDNPKLKGRLVLSYNESTQTWEYKKVLRWLERGTKETLVIKTKNHLIRCTKNHLIRTDKGWLEAGNVKEGMKILSPVNADAGNVSINKVSNLITTTSNSKQNLVENGYQIYKNTQFPQWTTNLEKVEFVRHDGYDKVYDLEVKDNHNFVANGLLVHNCHMLSTAAFNALLKTLEEPPDRVVFVLATTDPQRVLSTIISRCQRFDFRRIPLAEMVSHLKYIATQEQINITNEAITLVAQIANGGLRDAESLLDQLSLLPEIITVEQVWDLVGSVPEQDLLALLQAIAANQPEEVIDRCRNLLDRGREPLIVLQNLAGFYLSLLIAKTAPNRPDLTAVTETTWQNLCTQAQQWDTSEILRGQQQLRDSEVQLKNTTQPRLWLEVTLLGLLPLAHFVASSPVIDEDKEIRETRRQGDRETREAKRQGDKGDREDKVVSLSTAKINSPESNHLANAHPSQPIPNNHQTTFSSQGVISSPPPEQEIATELSEQVAPTLAEADTISHLPPQELWKKVMEHLHPPTTKALFQQKCHLIALEGSVARVGISSPQLIKLNQGKVPNLEAAFAKACQRTIKVKLEASTTQSQPESDISPSVQLPAQKSSIDPPTSTSITNLAESRESFTIAPEKKTLITDVKPPQQEITNNLSSPVKSNPEVVNQQTQIEKKDRSKVIPLKETSARIPKQTELSVTEPLPFKPDLESVNISAETTVQNYNSSDIDENLQKAVEALAKSFEGEIVTLAGAIDNQTEAIDLQESESDSSIEQVDNHNSSSDKLEHLPSQESEINHKGSSVNQSTIEQGLPPHQAIAPKSIVHTIVSNRPDLSEYEDEEDIPF